MSQLFPSGGQSIGPSASASVLQEIVAFLIVFVHWMKEGVTYPNIATAKIQLYSHFFSELGNKLIFHMKF